MMNQFLNELKFLEEEDHLILKQNVQQFSQELFAEQLRLIKKKEEKKIDLMQNPIAQDQVCISKLDRPFGAVILAAGQGSRLNFSLPKGCFEIALGQSLFSILCRKMKSPNGYIAIMTSAENNELIKNFFLQNAFFGLDPRKIDFFIQESFPVVNLDNKWVLNSEKKLFVAPAGNGSFYKSFYESPIYKKWKEIGIHALTVIPVDNFKANPQDEMLLGAIEEGVDLAVCAIEKKPLESIGTIALIDEKLTVLEYSEYQNTEEGLGYSGLFAIGIKFLKQAALTSLPLHLAKKKGNCFVQGKVVNQEIFKFEKFIFDAFSLTNHYRILNTCRKKYFCPLKDKEGPNGIEAVKASYQKEFL